MENIINDIIKLKKDIFGNNSTYKKLNIGFTNTIYNVGDKFIVKICTNSKNEKNFIKEINFYNLNKDNNMIPKLYYSDIRKNEVPYMYEIIEKIDGVALYDIWHLLSETEREQIIKQLCDVMKELHGNKGTYYNWCEKTCNLFKSLTEEAKEKNLLSNDEMEELNEVYLEIPKLIDTKELVLVHNDLHFDNIFYKDGKIKLIDFERSIYAPKEFELDILYRMIRKPWKFASEEIEKYTRIEDYMNIMTYIEKYYSELVSDGDLYKKLAIYDIIYFMKQYIEAPKYIELKEDIFKAVDILNNKCKSI